jgi:hypothetical protein
MRRQYYINVFDQCQFFWLSFVFQKGHGTVISKPRLCFVAFSLNFLNFCRRITGLYLKYTWLTSCHVPVNSSFRVILPYIQRQTAFSLDCHNRIEQKNHKALWFERVLRAVLFLQSPTVFIACSRTVAGNRAFDLWSWKCTRCYNGRITAAFTWSSCARL